MEQCEWRDETRFHQRSDLVELLYLRVINVSRYGGPCSMTRGSHIQSPLQAFSLLVPRSRVRFHDELGMDHTVVKAIFSDSHTTCFNVLLEAVEEASVACRASDILFCLQDDVETV